MALLLESAALFLALTLIFALVGFGPTALLLPDIDGAELLLAPAVGLATLYLSCQLFSSILPSSLVVAGTVAVGSLVSLTVLWRQRRALARRLARSRPALLFLVPTCVLSNLALQIRMVRAGTFTLTAAGGDDLFTWAPVADYMRRHAMTSGGHLSYQSPLLWILPANPYPGSAGTVDGGLGALLRLDGYQLVEPITAACLALAVMGVFLLVRVGLGLPRRAAAIAAALAATSEFRFYVAGIGLAQSARGALLAVAVLTLAMLAIRTASAGAGILAGGMAGVLAAVYMPLFLVAFSGLVGAAVVAAVIACRRGAHGHWRPLAAMALSGLVLGLPNVRWLLLDGGLGQWAGWSQYKSFGGAVWSHYPLSADVGVSPAAAAGLFSVPAVQVLSACLAVMAVILMATGALALARSHPVESACVLAPILYGAGVCANSGPALGTYLTLIYLAPLGAVLTAVGGERAAAALWKRRGCGLDITRRMSALLIGGIVFPILMFQTAATVEAEAQFNQLADTLPPSHLSLRVLASIIPVRSSVLMYSASGANVKDGALRSSLLAAAALFLPDRLITIEGRPYGGTTAQASDAAVVAADFTRDYSYILHFPDSDTAALIPPTYHRVAAPGLDGLVLEARTPPR